MRTLKFLLPLVIVILLSGIGLASGSFSANRDTPGSILSVMGLAGLVPAKDAEYETARNAYL
jgi:hypothetical protein